MRKRYDLNHCYAHSILILLQKAFHYSCNPGQLFDASIEACNEASKVDDYCNINVPKQPAIEPVVIDFAEFDCPDVGVFPDEESGCEKYYVCNKAFKSIKGFHYTCNPGQLFDAKLGACNEASAVDDYCNINKPSQPAIEPVVIDFAEFDCPDVGVFPDEESGCEKYYVCNANLKAQ